MLIGGRLEVKNFSVSYYGYGRKVEEAEFSLDEGEVLCLLGAEGSGKTTLLRGLAGLEESEGEVKIGGRELFSLPPKEREICYTFGEDSLEKKKTAAENILKPLKLRGASEEYMRQRLAFAARLTGAENILREKVKGLPPFYLAQIILARAFVRSTNLLLLDEPLSSLSFTQRKRLFDRLRAAAGEIGGRIIYATERPYEAQGLPDKVGIMSEGRLVQCAPLSEIYKDPAHRAAVEAFAPEISLLPARAVKAGGWAVEIGGERAKCAPLLSDVYDGREVIAAIRREDVSAGGKLPAKTLGVFDDGKCRCLRLGVKGGELLCAAEGRVESVSIARAAFVFDARSGFRIDKAAEKLPV